MSSDYVKKEILYIVSRDGELLIDYPEYWDDKEVVMAAVSNDGLALESVSPKLQNDPEVVMTAVSDDGYALCYASPGLQNDKEIVMAAVSNDSFTL